MHFEYEFADGMSRIGPDVATGATGWHDLPDKKLSRVSVHHSGGIAMIEKCNAYCIGVVTGEGAVFGGSRILAVHLFGFTSRGVRLIEVGPLGVIESFLPAERANNIGPWRPG